MKPLKLTFDTHGGTGKCVCKYGSMLRDEVVSLLGKGMETDVFMPGAGHHSTITTWTVDNPVTVGFIRKLCRDSALRSSAFYQRNRLNQLSLDKKWPMSCGKAVIQIGLDSQCHRR